ncbi:MAG TPA: alpha/beta hydrolase [Caulobacteraceae bacterium]|nr:alpha/beta hydrolase [Caulobacteraceae bacterium]
MGYAAPSIRTHPDVVQPAADRVEWIEGAHGHRQRSALYPVGDPVGSVVISSGRTEFIEKYAEVISELLDRRYSVLIHDWRGQGLSSRLLPDALKGHADRFQDLIDDYRALLDHYEPALPAPWIDLSHSMGGCLTLMAFAKGERRFAGSILSAPMLGLAAQRNRLLRIAVWVAAHTGFANAYAPGQVGDPYAATFESDRLTHDRARWERTHMLLLQHRDLGLGAPTLGWVESAFEALSWLHGAPEVERVEIPVVILSAGEENVVDNAGQRLMASRLPHCRLVEVPGALHEILMETDDIRAVFWREFDQLAAAIARPR